MNMFVLLAIVALNQDSSQFQQTWPAEKMTEAGAVEYFDAVAKRGITHFLINPNAHNTAYRSKVWDNIWRGDDAKHGLKREATKWVDNSQLLDERGVDFVGVWIRRARERGISPWLTMRMNDLHSIDKPLAVWRSSFWCEHPEFRRVAGSEGKDRWESAAFDFAHPEVREHALALVREMLEKWDVDGIECDWLRFPHHVSREEEKARTGHVHLTKVMREVRRLANEAAKRRGHPVLVGARVASRPRNAFGLGTDAETWAKEGLVDWLVPCNFFTSTDFALPMRQWVETIHGINPRVKVIAGCDFAGVVRDITGRTFPADITLPEVAGYFELMAEGGAEGAYYFNQFVCDEKSERDRFVQVEGVPMDGERLRAMDRAYAVTTIVDAVPVGGMGETQLPAKASDGAALRIPIGKAGVPSRARVRVLFTGKLEKGLESLVKLNGTAAKSVKEIDSVQWTRNWNDKRVTGAYEWEFAAEAAKDGGNVVQIAAVEGSQERIGACEMYLDK